MVGGRGGEGEVGVVGQEEGEGCWKLSGTSGINIKPEPRHQKEQIGVAHTLAADGYAVKRSAAL